ncbi:Mechanosensitive ion channel protein 10 [Linum perenne]
MPNSNINEKTLRRVSFSKDSDSDSDSDFDDDDSSKRHRSGKSKTKGKIIPFKFKVTRRAWIEFAFFLLFTTFLICSLTLNSLKNEFKFGIEIWKWCLMVLVLFSGRLVAGWAVGFLVFLIERNFILKEKILLVKVLASSFHVTTYFDRMKESVFHHYILEALSGPPLEVPVDGGSERRERRRRRGGGDGGGGAGRRRRR